MEFFNKANVIRLRSYHDKYMLADEDEETVYQDRNGTYKNALWTVEMAETGDAIRLKSCYGKYLTASNVPFLLKSTAKKVFQTLPNRLDSSVEWEPIREGVQVRLRTRYGRFLRGNGGLPPWRNTVTHDVPHRTATANWVLWDVDIVELLTPGSGHHKPRPAAITPPNYSPNYLMDISSANTSPGSGSDYSNKIELYSPRVDQGHYDSILSPKEGRTIYYSIGDENGEVSEGSKEKSFIFYGKSVEDLKENMKMQAGLDDLLVCCRSPLNSKLYPLRLHLPPIKTAMHVVVVPSTFQRKLSNFAIKQT
ncbi:hypothetical protein PIB30_006559 [Stylosanthes scabra]|uniref:DUF569 domain-containing protein n=1 Tax=Stylosanthes scabra TaxID=79078 RepID=A0ABU6X3F3_9FABA|nr:hypothetical protein [Stylosanthes scabra]